MAILKGNVIGNLKGKLGNLAARTVYGQTIMSARPSSFNVNNSDEAVAARQKFAVTVAFAKAVLNSANLKEIWDKVRIQGLSTFNTVFKSNYPFSSSLQPTISNIITPGGFTIPVTSSRANTVGLEISVDPLDTAAIFDRNESNLKAHALVCFYNPINPVDSAFQVIRSETPIDAVAKTAAFTISLTYDVLQAVIAGKYTNSFLYLAISSKDADGKVVQYSSTYSTLF